MKFDIDIETYRLVKNHPVIDREISGRQTGERWSSPLRGMGSSISRAELDNAEAARNTIEA
jgi:hypothetical protein